jgi:hypothetical protein
LKTGLCNSTKCVFRAQEKKNNQELLNVIEAKASEIVQTIRNGEIIENQKTNEKIIS